MAKSAVISNQQHHILPGLMDSLGGAQHPWPESCWEQRLFRDKTLPWARRQRSSSDNGVMAWRTAGMTPGTMLCPGEGTVLGSLPQDAHQTRVPSVQKHKATIDLATELTTGASPDLFYQFWSGYDRINPKPLFSTAVEYRCCSGLLLCSQAGQNLLMEGFFWK